MKYIYYYPIIGLGFGLGAPLIAQDSQKQEGIETLPLTVVDSEQEDLGNFSLSSDEIQLENPSDLKELFKKTPGVSVNGGAATGQQIVVNGFESINMNVTIDGASQGNLFHHQSSVLVDPGLLKSVEVVPGAGSALNGPGALVGALRFETKNTFDYLPYDASSNYRRFASDSKATYFGNGDGYSLSQTVVGKFSPEWGLLVNASISDRDNYKDGDGNVAKNTEYKRGSSLIKLSGRMADGHSLDLGLELFKDESFSYTRANGNPDLLPPGKLGPLQKLEAERQTLSLSYDINPDNNDLVDFESNLFWTNQDFFRETTQWKSEIQTLGMDVRNSFHFARITATVGADYQNKSAKSTLATGGDENEQIFGLYNQNLLSLHRDVDLSFGARFDSYDYTDVDANPFKSSRVNPNVSLIWRPVEHLSLDAGYAEAYRGVGIREAYLANGARPEGIEGEVGKTLKAGFSYDNQRFFSSGSIFQQSIDNYLNPTYRAPYNFDIETNGFDLRVGTRVNEFTGSLAVAQATPTSEGEKYDGVGVVVAGTRWIADLNYLFPGDAVRAGWSLEYRESVAEEATVGAKDSYFLNNLYVTWDVKQVEGLELQLNIDNLFDETYADHSIYNSIAYNSPGRQLRLSANYSF